MVNPYNNKIVLASGEVLIDLTGDTADAAHVLDGYTFHDKSGAPVTGTCTYDSDTSDDTVDAAHLAAGYTAHDKSGAAITGTASWRYDASTEELTVPSWALEVA